MRDLCLACLVLITVFRNGCEITMRFIVIVFKLDPGLYCKVASLYNFLLDVSHNYVMLCNLVSTIVYYSYYEQFI